MTPMSENGTVAAAGPRQYRAAAFNDLDVESNAKSNGRIAFTEERCGLRLNVPAILAACLPAAVLPPLCR